MVCRYALITHIDGIERECYSTPVRRNNGHVRVHARRLWTGRGCNDNDQYEESSCCIYHK